MAANKVRLRVVTPLEIKVDEQVDMAIMRCTDGDMGVLPGHAPRTTMLGDGVLRLMDGEEERKIAVFGGIAEIRDDVLTILANNAEWPEDIDRARAEASRDKATRTLKGQDGKPGKEVEIRSSQVRLRRSLVRIEVSSYPLVSKRKEQKKE